MSDIQEAPRRQTRHGEPAYRAAASERARASWRANQNKHSEAAAAGKSPSSVRDLRLALNKTQGEFAELIGLSSKNYKQVCAYENGLRPSSARIERMATLAREAEIEWTYER